MQIPEKVADVKQTYKLKTQILHPQLYIKFRSSVGIIQETFFQIDANFLDFIFKEMNTFNLEVLIRMRKNSFVQGGNFQTFFHLHRIIRIDFIQVKAPLPCGTHADDFVLQVSFEVFKICKFHHIHPEPPVVGIANEDEMSREVNCDTS